MTAAAKPLTLNEQLCFALYGASMAVGRLYKPLLDEVGITYPQYLVLSALWETDGQTVGAVAERLSLEPSTITPLVKRLAARGLVVRARNPADERQVRVTLTDEGCAMRARCRCLGEALLAASGLPLDRLERLNADVKAIRDALAGGRHGRTAAA